MSYTSITDMRSNRYPLMGDSGDGLGCAGGCGCGGSCGGTGSADTRGEATKYVGYLAIVMAGAGLFFLTSDRPVRANRRRRSSRRR